MKKSLTVQTNCISFLNIEEIQAYLSKNQSLIVPIGGLEPFGSLGVAGIPGFCSENLSCALALECDSLVAPLIPFSSSPVFKAFPGCAAMGSRTYENVLLNLCESWIYQGFKRILLVNSAFMPDHSLELVSKRLNSIADRGEVRIYSWQNDSRIHKRISSENQNVFSFERLEIALLSIAFYLNKDTIRDEAVLGNVAHVSIDEYKRWRKRGTDPQKYRKLFKTGISSQISSPITDSNLGKNLFGYILECMLNDNSSFLRANPKNAS